MPGESLDFSEDNLVRNSGFDTGATASAKYNYGGNLQMSTAYLARWAGPVLESEDAYGDGTTPAGLSARKHVQDISWYSPRTSEADNDRIKYALTTCGGVYVSMSWQGATGSSSDYYNAATHAYYYNGTTAGTNHAVLIVGWNDDYAASKFATTPPGNGAFIVRNSWGSGWGEAGYFYVSYYDTRLGRTSNAATLEGARSSTDYDAVYQYDPLGYTAAVGYGGATAWEANRFTATADSALNAVAFSPCPSTPPMQVYEGPSTASLTKVAQGTVPQMGFHTVTVPAGTDLANGAAFVVAVKLTSPGSSFPIALESPISGYASATAATGQSYISRDGGSWSDVAASYANTNVCLKAYVSRTPTSTSAYGFAADATSGWKTSAQTVTISASGGDDTSRTIHYSQDGGATWSTTAGHTADVFVNTEGAHHIEYYASDSLATETTHHSGWVNIDTVAPETTDDHPVTAVVGPVTITLAPSDATSGTAGGKAKTEYKTDGAGGYATGTTVVLGEGSHTIAYRSTDAAGNVETPDKTCSVTVMGPLLPVSACGYTFAADAVSGWKNAAQTVTITAAGGRGTGRTVHYSLDGGVTWGASAADKVDVPVTSQGAHHVEFYVSDSLASESAHDAGWVNLDSGKPSTSASKATVRKGRKVTLKFRVHDGLPGCGRAVVKLQIRRRTRVVKTITLGTRPANAALTYRYAAKLKKGTYTYRILATDIAGNHAAKMVWARLRIR